MPPGQGRGARKTAERPTAARPSGRHRRDDEAETFGVPTRRCYRSWAARPGVTPTESGDERPESDPAEPPGPAEPEGRTVSGPPLAPNQRAGASADFLRLASTWSTRP